MPKDTIGMLPACGFNPASNMSRDCALWLKFLSNTENFTDKNGKVKKISIQHALNGGEKKIGPYFVDGYCEDNKTIYEFNG